MTPGADAAAFDDSKFQRVTLPHHQRRSALAQLRR